MSILRLVPPDHDTRNRPAPRKPARRHNGRLIPILRIAAAGLPGDEVEIRLVTFDEIRKGC